MRTLFYMLNFAGLTACKVTNAVGGAESARQKRRHRDLFDAL